MSRAVQAYRGVTATEEFRSLEWLRRKTEHDEAQAMYNAEKKGEVRGEIKGMEKMIIAAIKNNVPLPALEAMRESAGVSKQRLTELIAKHGKKKQ